MRKAKYNTVFDQERCKGCALCAKFCPAKIIKMDMSKINKSGYHPATVTESDKCLGCGNCATICPDCVITIEREDAQGGDADNG